MHIERIREAVYVSQCNITFPALDATHVRSVDARASRKRFLSESGGETKFPNPHPETIKLIRFHNAQFSPA